VRRDVLENEFALELIVERAECGGARARAHAWRLSSTAKGEGHKFARARQASN
jgi:hypothetical protein